MSTKHPVLVTGATGFIGTQLLETLAENHFSGFSLVHQSPSKARNELVSIKFKEIQGDLSFDFFSQFLKENKPEVIFHLAGITNPTHPDLFQVNVDGLENLIRAVETHSPRSTIVFMSTAAVYGEGESRAPFQENDPLRPVNAYGESKKAAEKLLQNFVDRNGKVYIARAFNVVGKNQSANFFLPTLCKKIADLEKSHAENKLIVRDPESIRDFIDIRDLTAGLVQMIVKNAPFGVYNFSSGVGVSIQKTTEIALKLVSKKIVVEYVRSEANPNSIKVSVGNPSKALAAFDWKPRYSLYDSISEILGLFNQG